MNPDVNHERLIRLLADGNWHATNDLAVCLGLDSQSLTALLMTLSGLGLELESDPDLGLRLPEGFVPLDRELILAAMPTELRDSIGRFELTLSTASTNATAMQWLHEGGTGRALFLTESQTAGRGRRGRTWISPLAGNLYLSLVWPVTDCHKALEGLSLVTALCLVDALRQSPLEGMERLNVKWPNDVWLGDAKLAGILLESQSGSTGPLHVVIGIGLNVRLPRPYGQNLQQPATDLFAAGNRRVNRNLLVGRLLASLAEHLDRHSRRGFGVYRDSWQALDRFQGRDVRLLSGNSELAGRVRGVSESGALILDTPAGERQFTAGELAPSVRQTV